MNNLSPRDHAGKNSSSNRYFPPLPFAHLNLRFNPFGELPLDYRAELAIGDMSPFVAKLDDPQYALQFMGEKGRGKTTHLLAIKSHFQCSEYIHIPEDETVKIPKVKFDVPFFVDEAQRLSPRQQHRCFSQKVPLVIGTHRCLEPELKQYRYQVETIKVCKLTSAEKIFEVTNRRVEFARRDGGEIPSIKIETAKRLYHEHGTDIRAIESHLYDLFQALEQVKDV